MSTSPTGQPALPAPDVTVIITTRNRATQLPDVLGRLAVQETHGRFAWDVLVVDNGSSDGTPQVVAEQRRSFPVPIHYVREERVGRPFALNTALAHARGRLFAFTDDDTLPMPSWLATLRTCLLEEGADAVTGRVLPHFLAARPGWLTAEAFRQIGRLGCLDHGPDRRRTSERQDCRWLTSNLVIRRDATERIGGWDERLPFLQDTEYYRRAVRAGLAVVYEPAAIVYHKIGPERLIPRYFRRRRRQAGLYHALEMPWTRADLLTIAPLGLYTRIARLAAGWVRRTLSGAPWWQRFACELALRDAVSTWRYRARLWPRWWLTVLTGRSHLP